MIPARAEFAVDCRLPPGLGDDVALTRATELLGDAQDGLELDWTEAIVGNRSPLASPLMDAIADWVAAADPGAEAVPVTPRSRRWPTTRCSACSRPWSGSARPGWRTR